MTKTLTIEGKKFMRVFIDVNLSSLSYKENNLVNGVKDFVIGSYLYLSD